MRVERAARLAEVSGTGMQEREALVAVAHEIRRIVFVDEQHIAAELEWDALDDEAEHFVAFSASGEALGTARMRVVDGVAKAERVAVRPQARRTGAGRLLMEAIESRATEIGLDQVRLNAQVAVVPFYEQVGYKAYGPIFVEADIDHLAMARSI